MLKAGMWWGGRESRVMYGRSSNGVEAAGIKP